MPVSMNTKCIDCVSDIELLCFLVNIMNRQWPVFLVINKNNDSLESKISLRVKKSLPW